MTRLHFHFEPDQLGLSCSRMPQLRKNTHLFVNGAFPPIESPWIFPSLAYT